MKGYVYGQRIEVMLQKLDTAYLEKECHNENPR